MSTIKISQLSALPSIATNTSNTLMLGVNTQTGVTGNFTVTSLAQQMFANNYLAVGTNMTQLPSTIGQFQSSDLNAVRVNLLNTNVNGSAAYIAGADTTNGSNSFISFGITNSYYSNSAWSAVKPYDGVIYVRGPSTTSYTGNLILGAASANANVSFLVGGTTSANMVSVMSKTGLMFVNGTYVTFSDGTTISTAPALIGYSQAGFALANTNSAQLVYVAAVDNTQNTNISSTDGKMQSAYNLANSAAALVTYLSNVDTTQNSWITSTNSFATSAYGQANAATITAAQGWIQANGANSYAYSAFAKANNALANTSGTFAGDLTFTGNTSAKIVTANSLVSTYISKFVNAAIPSTNALVEIVGSTGGTQISPGNPGYMIHITGQDGTSSRIINDSFGTGAYPVIAGRKANGTAASPTAASNNDILFRISGNGYGTTGFNANGSSRIDFVATENFTDTTRGTQIQFWNTPNNSNTLQRIATLNANTVEFVGTVNPQKGFIYSSNVVSSNVTSYNLDFSGNAVYKLSCSAPLTLTLSNFTAGKVMEVWLTHYGNNNDAITHGCLALNSTKAATSFNVNTPQLIYMKYFSLDGDLANTYVHITSS